MDSRQKSQDDNGTCIHTYIHIQRHTLSAAAIAEEPYSRQTEEPYSRQTEEPYSRQTEEPCSRQTEEPYSRQTEEPYSRHSHKTSIVHKYIHIHTYLLRSVGK